jgi:crotonobetainyl-CoA:carnitine CoA-transferase CaiB-like acyl-CoA transferase
MGEARKIRGATVEAVVTMLSEKKYMYQKEGGENQKMNGKFFFLARY